MTPNRQAYGETLIELAKANPDIVLVDTDVEKSNGTHEFRNLYPDRFFIAGIAEQNAAGVAAGLASCGKTAFMATFAVFTSMRACEQIRNAVCYGNFNVKAVGTHAGIETGADGPTHQAVEDIAIMRAIPNQRVLCPATPNATRCLTTLMAETYGPFYMRFGKDPVPELYDKDEEFPLGGSKTLRSGDDAAIIACGSMVALAMQAADELAQQGRQVRVIDMYSIKPADQQAIVAAARETKGIVTLEDHSIIGGLGGCVAEITAAQAPAKVVRLGLQNTFGLAGNSGELRTLFGLTADAVVQAVNSL